MKNTVLLAVLIFILGMHTHYGQSVRSIDKNEWLVSVGVNAINSQGSKSPFGSISDWAFRFPLAVGVETKWTRLFSLEIAANLNGFEEGAVLDAAGPPDDDLVYLSLDANLKYYFGEYVFKNAEWLDFYALAGIGYFDLDGGNLSANVGGGAMIWVNSNKTFALKPQVVGKFAFNHSNKGSLYANNHIQFNMMAVIKL